MSRSQLDGKIQFKFFLHMIVHVKCSCCVLKISNVHFLSLSLDYCMRCAGGFMPTHYEISSDFPLDDCIL